MPRFTKLAFLALALVGILSRGAAGAEFETGSVSLRRTIDSAPGNSAWERVDLKASYSGPPVIIAGPPTHANDHSLSVRVRNVTATSFEIALTSPCDSTDTDPNAAGNPCPPPAPGNSPPWASETVHYLAVPPGVWQFPDGTKIEAATRSVSAVRSGLGNSNAGEPVAFQHSYTSRPLVLHSVNTTDDPDWITSSVFGPGNAVGSPPDTAGFAIALEGAEVTAAHGAETVGWVAIEAASGINNGHRYFAGLTPGLDIDRHDDGCFAVGSFTGFAGVPDVVAGHNSMQGTNGAWARYCAGGVELAQINLHMDEDQVNDAERTGLPEAVSWFAFEADSIGLLVASGSVSPFLARDSFEPYTAGASIDGANAGAFWAGPWSGQGGVEAILDTAGAALAFTDEGDTIDGGERALRFAGNSDTAATRDLARTVSDPVVYAAMLVRFEGTQNANDFLALWFENSGFGAAPNFGIKMNHGDDSGAEDFFARTVTNEVFTIDLQNGQTYLLVARLEKSASASYDQVTLWVNPSNLGNAAPPGATAQTNVLDSGVSAFDTIGFRAVNLDADDSVTIDELRLGTSWAEVTAPNVLPVQAGRLQLDTESDPAFSAVTLSGFDRRPLVLATASTDGTDSPAAARVRNLSATGFEVAPVEPSAGDGPHASLEIDYVALGEIEAGERKLYLLDDIDAMDELAELGRHDTSAFQSKLLAGSGWDTLAYLGRFADPPVVLAGLQSMRNESGGPPQSPSVPWLQSAVANVTGSGFQLALERAESTAGSITTDETIGLVILRDGSSGTLAGGVDYAALRSADAIVGFDNGCRSTAFGLSFADPPVLVANRNTRDGVDGGWIRRCALSANDVGLLVDEDQDNDSDRRHTSEAAAILAVANIPRAGLDHYAISHDGSGVTCLAEEIRITAHAEDHSPVDPAAATITLATTAGRGDWSALVAGSGVLDNGAAGDGAATYTFAAGETSVTLAFNFTEILAGDSESFFFDVSDGTVADRGDGAAEDPEMRFARTGLRFLNATGGSASIPAQIAGKPSDVAPAASDIRLQAIRSADEDPSVCEPVFPDGATRTLELAAECRNPATCAGNQVSINASPVATNGDDGAPGTGGYTPLALTFGPDSAAPLVLAYFDAGLMQLHGRFEIPLEDGSPSGDFMLGSSNAFVVRPFGFDVAVAGNPGAVDAGGSVFVAAGQDFEVTATAVAWQQADDGDNDGIPDGHAAGDADAGNNVSLADNIPTPNFGREATPAEALLSPRLDQPAGGANGALTGATALAGFSGGAASGTVQYTEVGIIELRAETADYLGAGAGPSGVSGHTGRFIPFDFEVTQNTPELGTACSPAYTYIGQRFRYNTAPVLTVTARARGGTTTENYAGDFFKLTEAKLAADGDKTYAPAGLDTALVPAVDPTVQALGGGTATLRFSDGGGLAFFRNAPEAPFDAAISLSINVLDEDEVAYGDGAGNSLNPARIPETGAMAFDASPEQRWGRLVIANAGGSELLPLALPMRTQYFDGAAFVANTQDACSSFAATDLVLSNALESGQSDGDILVSIGPACSGAGSSTATIADDPFLDGAAGLSFSAPGEGCTGFVDVTLPLDALGASYLQFDWDGDGTHAEDPQGRASFGIFSGSGELIYAREPWN